MRGSSGSRRVGARRGPVSGTIPVIVTTVAMVVGLFVLAACQAPPPKTRHEVPPVTIADLTDEPSRSVVAPWGLEMPEGVPPDLVHHLAGTLSDALARSLETEESSELDEAASVHRVLRPLSEQGALVWQEQAADFFGGPGFSWPFTARLAAEHPLTAPVHVVAISWETALEEGDLGVTATVQTALQFERGVAIVVRTLGYWAIDVDAWTSGRAGRVDVTWRASSRGIDLCTLLLEGTMTPGDLRAVAADLDRYRPADDGTVRRDVAEPGGDELDPVARRERCEVERREAPGSPEEPAQA